MTRVGYWTHFGRHRWLFEGAFDCFWYATPGFAVAVKHQFPEKAIRLQRMKGTAESRFHGRRGSERRKLSGSEESSIRPASQDTCVVLRYWRIVRIPSKLADGSPNPRQEIVMAEDIYETLAAHLDTLPAGFPRTPDGAEMRILRRLFTPEDATLAIQLTIIPEEARVVARRAGISVPEAGRRLDEMDRKGLVMRVEQNDQPPRYMALQYVLGFWEAQINRLTPELVEDALEYETAYLRPDQWRKAPQLRTIPVHKSIDVHNNVMPYEMAEEMARSHASFAVVNCICRQAMRVVGRGCNKPEESCLGLGAAAEYAVRSGRGRRITLNETLEILEQADENGLVLQPDNAKDPLFICMCCGCCCGVLRALKRAPKPGKTVSSPFLASLETSTCNGCGICTKRCQMEAVRLNGKKAILDVDRCIGCGLCVSTCPTHSLSLVRRPASEQVSIPRDHVKSLINVGQARGRLRMFELISLQIKSKLDRLLAPK